MKNYQNKEELQIALINLKTIKNVALFFNVNNKTIKRWMDYYSITGIGSQGARKHTCNEHFFDTIDTQEKAYWLGFLYADGCVYKGSDGKSYRLQINLKASDSRILEEFNKAIESNYIIKYKNIINKENNNVYETVQIKINNTYLCKQLISLGVVPKKSLICKFPNIDKNLIRHFIRGYFDGDGCITSTNKNNRISWKVNIIGNKSMIESFYDIFSKNNIDSCMYHIKHSKVISIDICSKKSILNFYNYLYKDSTIFMHRKYNHFEDFKKHLSN